MNQKLFLEEDDWKYGERKVSLESKNLCLIVLCGSMGEGVNAMESNVQVKASSPHILPRA